MAVTFQKYILILMLFSLLSAVSESKMDKAAELMQFLSTVFPTLDEENLKEIRVELDKLGCDEVEYLQHATEDDLHFLKPLRRRKLLAAISESKHGICFNPTTSKCGKGALQNKMFCGELGTTVT